MDIYSSFRCIFNDLEIYLEICLILLDISYAILDMYNSIGDTSK